MTLSPEQTSYVRKYVDQNNIRIYTLRDDVLDHICCSVEFKIDEGKTFEDSLREAVDELAPEGLRKLEFETILLLESKNILMKKFMYFIGLITTIAMSMGFTFRILRLPGGFELLNYGFLAFAFIFLPMVTYNNFRMNVKRTFAEKLRIILGIVSALCTGAAVFFKMIHYPGVDPLLLAGMVIFSFGFLPCLFYTLYERSVIMPVQDKISQS
jgi:hypothetical protein